jgi:signal transduction histidine kinase
MIGSKILVVEDERIVAKDISKRLEKLGYIVVATASSGQEAIRKAIETRPDLVLMDVQLRGDMDGVDTAQHIRADIDIPVIYLTAYADQNTLQRAKITEPFGYIVKPFDERDLHAAIEIALRRHLAEVAVHVALQKEKELSELKSRFWSMVAHEFRSPLTTISASAQLLEHHGHQLNEERRREYLYMIREAAEAMNNLLNDVLSVGKAEGGSLKFKPELIDLEEFCRTLVEEIQFHAGARHRLVFRAQGQCVDIYADRQLIWHILNNLLSNAIKYSPHGGDVELTLICSEREVVFQVKDTGIGIPQEDQQHLFESFHRANNVGNIPGTGLGLTMVKKCTELHNGEIQVESRINVGSTFTVTLPVISNVVRVT